MNKLVHIDYVKLHLEGFSIMACKITMKRVSPLYIRACIKPSIFIL